MSDDAPTRMVTWMPLAEWLLTAGPAVLAMVGAWLNLTLGWFFDSNRAGELSIILMRICVGVPCLLLLIMFVDGLYVSVVKRLDRRSPPWVLMRMWSCYGIGAIAFVAGVTIMAVAMSSGGPSVQTVGSWLIRWSYNLSQYVGLAQIGFLLGCCFFVVLVTLGCGGALCFNCFGKADFVQQLLRSRRTPPPIVDMVQNHGRSPVLGVLLMLHLYYLQIDGPLSDAKWALCRERALATRVEQMVPNQGSNF